MSRFDGWPRPPRPSTHSSAGRPPGRSVAVWLLLALGGPLSAAEPVALDALVAETVARNPELKFYEAEIAAARGGRTTAGWRKRGMP